MTGRAGIELSLVEATQVFRTFPPNWQLASLHPDLVRLDALRDPSLRPVHWYFQLDDQHFLHSFHLGLSLGNRINDIQSAYGYGGPVSDSDDPRFMAAADLAFRDWAADHSVVAEFHRLHPLVPHERWYQGDCEYNRDSVVLNLREDLFQQYQGNRRTDVRRFLEGPVTARKVSPSAMLDTFPSLYRDTMDRVGASSFYYLPAQYFESLFEYRGCANWLVYLDGQAIAGAAILQSDTAEVAEYHLGASAGGYERYRATVGLLHAVASYYKELSYRLLFFGGGRSADPKDSLFVFKKGFSSWTVPYRIGKRVLDVATYSRLSAEMPERAATGRVLFYRD